MTRYNYEKFGAEYQRQIGDKKRLRSGQELIACLICGRKFIQPCSHIYQVHGLTAREYRKEFGFDNKRGLVPAEYRELKAQQCKENGTINNLRAGKKFWFTKNDPEAGRYERSLQTKLRLKDQFKNIKIRKSKLEGQQNEN